MISITLLVVLLGALVMYFKNQHKKELHDKMLERLEECKLITHVKEQPEIDIFNFQDAELKEIRFEILRNNRSIEDTIIYGTKNEEHITSIAIPFKTFLRSDTILLTIDNKLQYYISNFNYSVTELYGMFGPVTISDCFLVESYTINDNQDTKGISKFYGILESEKNISVQRISNRNHNYKDIVEKFAINEKQTDSIGRMLSGKYKRGGSGINFGIEINQNNSYYLRGIFNENKEIEIVKINTESGEFTKAIKNYPIDNEY
ncbi:hypothetical protein FHK87_23070 [Aquimarina algicola]|uniref:Uncharacterized protein n=2 Tax=Aquimarina algicola TaxID=2589995 RepID=A0A504J5G5_9FLAO|nr:hypothetical protein FHK87_23070 [Aquimarina algicola]